MKLDKSCSLPTAFIGAMLLLTPAAAGLQIPLLGGKLVHAIEEGQALFLFFGALFTGLWIIKHHPKNEQRQFWLWATLWWLTLLGRSTSWGRDYFRLEPHWLMRGISVILIASLLLFLFSPVLRRAIHYRWNTFSLPLWPMVIAIAGFIGSDAVEHHRLIAHFILTDPHYQDLTEELFENPLLLSLFQITAYVLRQETSVSHSPEASSTLVPSEGQA